MRRLAFALRGAFLILILLDAARGEWRSVVFNAAVFAATTPILAAGLRAERYLRADALVVALFILAGIASLFGNSLESTVVGLDKLFHAAGGGAAAFLSFVALRPHVRDRRVLALLAAVGALAIGAAWEVYEWVFFTLFAPHERTALAYTDTILDLVADTLGGVVAAMLLSRRR